MKPKIWTLMLALAGASACAAPDGDPEPVSAGAEDLVWVTIGADAIDAVSAAMERGAIEGTFQAVADDTEVTLLRVPRQSMAQLTRLMHDTFHRCGGYVAHDSYENAIQTLDNKRMQAALDQQFVSYSIDNPAAVEALLPTLDQSNLLSIITHLSTAYTNRYHTTANGTAAAMWIRDTWQGYIDAAGRTDASVDLVQHSGTNQPSVILTIEGDLVVDEVVVLGGHLDSTAGSGTGANTPAPGADDDASGVAALSEVARVILAQGFRPDRTLKFMAYAAEEVGLIGSGEIADDFSTQGINVVGVMQLDMTNYQGSSQDIVLIDDYTNAAQNAFLGDLIDEYLGLSWTYSTCGYGCSDHASWTSAGYPASIPFEALFNDYNPNIHSGADTLANSDASGDHTMKFARLAIAYIAELSKGDFVDDWTPPAGSTVEFHPGGVGRYEARRYGPYPVTPGSTFQARLGATSGYSDVYVRFDAPPTTTEYDCRPYLSDLEESCTLVVPAGAAEAHVWVRGYESSYTLSVAYVDSTPPAAPTMVDESGALTAGQVRHYGGYPVSSGSRFIAEMSGDNDVDMFVRFGASPTENDWDCRPYTSTSNETCTRFVPAGESQAFVMLRGFAANSSYDLRITHTP